MVNAELKIVEGRSIAIEAAIAALAKAPWPERARAADEQLVGIHGDWWERHAQDPGAYEQRMAELNALAGWCSEYAQVSSTDRYGEPLLTPPKFFGGNPTKLAETFILAFSLNHAMPDNSDYIAELREFQGRESCLRAHRDYFQRPWAYERFFRNGRMPTLQAYARARGESVRPGDWRWMNERYSLYLERCPTLSPKFQDARTGYLRLEEDVFEMRLNRLAHRAVFGLLRPQVVLLAGRDTWGIVPRHPGQEEDVSAQVRPDQALRCPVFVDHIGLEPGAAPGIVRCNFLVTVYGPNSIEERVALGEVMARAATGGNTAPIRARGCPIRRPRVAR
jgi:hypothetical protein